MSAGSTGPGANAQAAGFAVKDGQTVVFIGDSITDCGRRAEFAPMGNGYVNMAVALITVRYPGRKIAFFNHGIGGDVATGLRDRWTDDVAYHRPDWVSVLVGINDLHRTLRRSPDAVDPATYRAACDSFCRRTTDGLGARLVLMDPFYMSRESGGDTWRGMVLALLPRYIEVVEEMADRYGAIRVRLHDMYQRVLQHRPADYVCPEPVHPNAAGHLMIAHEWLTAMGW